MLIDQTHRRWFFFALAALAVSGAAYAIYSIFSVQGPGGGTVMGLIFAGIGSTFMVFAALLGARKKLMLWRVGRASSWMRGHIWLGFLSFPIILFHSAFSFGAGTLTRVLMVLFVVVFVSGIFGAILQHYMPRMITARVPMETIYEQIDRIRLQLVDDADRLVADMQSALLGELSLAGEKHRSAAASAGSSDDSSYGAALGANERAATALIDLHQTKVRPFLLQTSGPMPPFADPVQSSAMFAQLRVLVPREHWPNLQDIESICEEKRQLDRQRSMHKVLHGWLLFHIPTSYALILLGAVHAVYALRY